MYIMVRQIDRVIIGNAINPVSIEHASSNGYDIFEINDTEFSVDMLGSTLNYYELAEKQ